MDVCSIVSLSPSTNQIQRQGTSETCIECSKDEKRNKKVNVRKELLDGVGMVTCVLLFLSCLLEKELAVNYVTFYIGFCLLGLREESKLNFHLEILVNY